VPLQTLVRLVKEQDGGVFGPEDIAVMATAFDRLLADYKLVDRNDPIVTMLAKLVIEIVRNGERDPERIRQEVLGHLRQTPNPMRSLQHWRDSGRRSPRILIGTTSRTRLSLSS
jgi:hypothetical protein